MVDDSTIKAKLKISLHAGNVLVAESQDPILWQKVFASITSKNQDSYKDNGETFIGQNQENSKESFSSDTSFNSTDAIFKLARDVGVTQEQIIGACSPSLEAPYIHLDMKYWEAFFKNSPPRGPSAISKIGLAATLLCLWFRAAKIEGNPTAVDCQQVLETVNTREANPTRSIDNSGWLQRRGKGIVINPAKTSRALEIARTYCLEGKA